MNKAVQELIAELDKRKVTYVINEGILITQGYRISTVTGRTASSITSAEEILRTVRREL